MPTTATTMSWNEYQRLDEDIRAEYIDGRAVVNPRPSRRHQHAIYELTSTLRAAATEPVCVEAEWAWKPADDEFVPDVIVTEPTAEQARFTGTPLLVIEVLSPNRAHLVTKSMKYAQHGLPRYWVVDPDEETATAFALVDGVYAEVGLVHGTEEAEWGFGAGIVHIRPADLFG
jgi:Uma2 family endonuclease